MAGWVRMNSPRDLGKSVSNNSKVNNYRSTDLVEGETVNTVTGGQNKVTRRTVHCVTSSDHFPAGTKNVLNRALRTILLQLV